MRAKVQCGGINIHLQRCGHMLGNGFAYCVDHDPRFPRPAKEQARRRALLAERDAA